MDKNNLTIVTELLLLGFPQINGSKAIILFLLILTAYIMTLILNCIIIVLVSTRQQLYTPMYFFLQQLSCSEILVLSVVVPNMLRVIWLEGATISVTGCITQNYIYCSTGCTECHLLAVMSYDRYLAICKPLRYNTIMNIKLQHALAIYCWVFGFLLNQITMNFLCQVHFCASNIIDHFFCDLVPFVDLSCSYTYVLQLDILIISIFVVVIPFILVVISYICVFITIIGISSTASRKKTFSTCSSHLSVVTIFYGTLITIYIIPSNGHSLTINKLISLLYIVVTPLFNPIIYSLRNKEMRLVMGNLLNFRWQRQEET